MIPYLNIFMNLLKTLFLMKNKIYLIFLMGIFSSSILSQNKDFSYEFDNFSIITIKNGSKINQTIIGSNPKVIFRKDKGIYYIEYLSKERTSTMLLFKIETIIDNMNLVKIIGDDSPRKILFMFIDKYQSDKKIEFTSQTNTGINNEIRLIYRFSNEVQSL